MQEQEIYVEYRNSKEVSKNIGLLLLWQKALLQLFANRCFIDVGLVPSERVEVSTGIRCLTVSPDGKHLVAGTKCGNLQLVDLP